MKVWRCFILLVSIILLCSCEPEPLPPRAVIQGPEMVVVGEVVKFDARLSAVDPDSLYTLYAWEVGGRDLGPVPTIFVDWGEPGTYEVKLTVTDSEGLRDTAVLEVLVLDDVRD